MKANPLRIKRGAKRASARAGKRRANPRQTWRVDLPTLTAEQKRHVVRMTERWGGDLKKGYAVFYTPTDAAEAAAGYRAWGVAVGAPSTTLKRNPASASDYRVTVKYPSGQARTYTSVHRMFGGARPSEIAGDEARKAPNGTIVEVRESNVGRPGGLVYRYQVVGYGAVQSMKEKSAGGRSAKRNPNLEDFADVNAYLAAVKGEQARATRLIRLKWTRDEVGGVGRWTAKTGGVTVHVYEPAKHFAGLYQVYVGRQHYSNEDSLAAAKDKAREAVGYYLGVSSNMMGRMASESERARAQRENPAKRARSTKRNPAVSADTVIRAFLDGKEATSKQLTSSGVRLDGNWTGGRGLAEWVGGRIKLGYPYGNVTQSWLKKVARMAPAYLLTDDSRWALPGKTVKLLKREGR